MSSGPIVVAHGGTIATQILKNTLSMSIPPLRCFVYEFVLFIVRRIVTAPNLNFHENKRLQGTTTPYNILYIIISIIVGV